MILRCGDHTVFSSVSTPAGGSTRPVGQPQGKQDYFCRCLLDVGQPSTIHPPAAWRKNLALCRCLRRGFERLDECSSREEFASERRRGSPLGLSTCTESTTFGTGPYMLKKKRLTFSRKRVTKHTSPVDPELNKVQSKSLLLCLS
ncbi:unnamed protein product [Ectocarpus sp. CCAP 1310/34]|nr:unnamed protein product [Ectocarpus sp. CCAP 1310/34]